MRARVILADDHQMMREGLRTVLEQQSGVEVVGEADDGRGALRMVEELAPHVVVMDVGMPELNGIEATRQITSKHPAVKVVALSIHCDRRYVLEMLEAGASAYVVKEAAASDLIDAIHAVMRNRKYLSPQITDVVVDSYVEMRIPIETAASTALGPREREVLQLLAEGHTSSAIASKLHISVSTVETHRRNIMRKLDLHSVAELTKYAIREGLTTPEP
ncbi:response regulator transcription factor [Candidatus Sumerlaeota bacterium]|nr:response regulator transcription factor [Candidatus Sumerlaeota bacterium]